MKSNLLSLSFFLFCIALFSLFSCDMAFIPDPFSPDDTTARDLTEDEKNEIELNGRFLKIYNLPLNTQVTNVFSVQISNSLANIGGLNKNNNVFIFRENNSSTVYLPLVYNNDLDFFETGFFYTAFTIHVDAVTRFIVDISDRFLVFYTEGRGEIDILSLPSASSSQEPGASREISDGEKDEIEKSGHYLKLFNMPPNTQAPNVFSVVIANSFSSIAKLNPKSAVLIYKNQGSSTVYLPLIYNNNSDFLETGLFFTAVNNHK